MPAFIFLIIVGVIVFFVVKSKKKKKESDDAYEKITTFSKEIVACTKVEFPHFYFEKKFLSWVPYKLNENNIENDFLSIQSFFNLSNLDPLRDGLNFFERECIPSSLLFENSEEYANKTEEDISKEIILYLPLYSSLKRGWDSYKLNIKLIIGYQNFTEQYVSGLFGSEFENDDEKNAHEKAVALCKETYRYALSLKWDKIRSEYPHWNTEENQQLFMREGDYKFELWKPFYMEKFLDFNDRIGINAFSEELTKILKSASPNLVAALSRNVSEYSSIYEIDDFSEENITRIIELYKNGTISGVYSKSKDPKYRT